MFRTLAWHQLFMKLSDHSHGVLCLDPLAEHIQATYALYGLPCASERRCETYVLGCGPGRNCCSARLSWLIQLPLPPEQSAESILDDKDLHRPSDYIRCRCDAGLGHLPHNIMQMYINTKYASLLKSKRPSHHIAAWNTGVEWKRMMFLRSHSPPAAAAEEMDAVELPLLLPQYWFSRWRP